MKKILFYLILILNTLIINNLYSNNDKDIYKLEKNSLNNLYKLEPKYANIEIPINKSGTTKKFILKKSDHLDKDFAILTNNGKIFKDKKYLGITYEIHDAIEGNYVGHLMSFNNFTKCSFKYNEKSFIVTSENNEKVKINSKRIDLDDNYKNINDLMKNFNSNKDLKQAIDSKTKQNLKNIVNRIQKNDKEKNKNITTENQSKIFDLNQLGSVGNISSSPQKANAPPSVGPPINIGEIFIGSQNQPLTFVTEGESNHGLVSGDKILLNVPLFLIKFS